MDLPHSFPPLFWLHRRYFLRRSDCHVFFLSGKRSGIRMRRKSWMHFCSSCSGVNFSLVVFLLDGVMWSRGPVVRVRKSSVLRRVSVCIAWAGPFFTVRSRVWMWWCCWETGRAITVSWGELASDWVSEQEVESSLKDVPLSPSRSLFWLLQQHSQWEDDQADGPPGEHTEKTEKIWSNQDMLVWDISTYNAIISA